MKKLFSVLFLLLLTVPLTACHQPKQEEPALCQHRDSDDNSLCDTCGEAYADGLDTEIYICRHRDANDDGKCDECRRAYTDGKDIADTICQHRDADDDSKCDKCNADYTDGADVTHSHSFGDWILYGDAANTPCQDRLFYRTCPSCNDIEWKNGGYESHTFQTVTIAPTCTAEGYDEKTCSSCGLVEKVNEKPIADHNYKTTYTTDASFHWLDCEDCDATKSYAEHIADESGSCTVCGQPILPTEGIVYDLSADGTYAEVIAYNGTAKRILIADTYQGVPVKKIYREAFKNSDITEVIIPDSVTSIGSSAFYGCTSLTSVTIGDSVTSIGNSAFSWCYSLTSVTIGDSVTSIGSSAFSYCYSLTSVTIGDSVTSIGSEAFRGCSGLTSVTIPDSVTSIGSEAFRGCSGLTSVTIPDSVISIGSDAFYGCNSALYMEYEYGKYVGNSENPYQVLIEVTNQNLSTYKIHEDTKIIANSVFSSCARLTSITIPDSVTSIGEEAFYTCSSLESVTIGNSVTSIGTNAFFNCYRLTSVTIPDSVTSIGDYAFENCSNLESVTIGNSVISIGNSAFHNCSSLTSVTIGNSVISIGNSAFHNCSSLTSVTIGDSVTSIGDRAFYNYSSLTSVYYMGTEEDWNEIDIGQYNNPLENATRYYYSETTPTEEGNYWHYDANGEIEIWP